MSYWEIYPSIAPRPQPVSGKERKKFGLTWWGRRWVDIVEDIGDESRMSRGRSYARADKAFNISVSLGKITAKVEGNSGTYRVSVVFEQLNQRNKQNLYSELKTNALVSGALLNNELSPDFEQQCGIDIIPRNFEASCSCPDGVNPCKHIAAIFYVIADEIDKAPQILFTLQGIDRKDLLELLCGNKQNETNNIRRRKTKHKQ